MWLRKLYFIVLFCGEHHHKKWRHSRKILRVNFKMQESIYLVLWRNYDTGSWLCHCCTRQRCHGRWRDICEESIFWEGKSIEKEEWKHEREECNFGIVEDVCSFIAYTQFMKWVFKYIETDKNYSATDAEFFESLNVCC